MKKILFVALALVFGLVSCVKDKPYPGITITNVSYSPTAVTEFSNVTVSATITSFNDFTAKLVYTVNNGNNELVMTAAGDVFTAVIPAQPNNTTVSFYVEASNKDVTTTSATMSYTVGAVPVNYNTLRLNELNGNDKFIEIYNTGNEAINLNGVYIVKDGTTTNWTGDNSINLNAGEYLLLYSVDVQQDHPEHPANLIFSTGLSAKKNVRIQLFTPAGESIDDFNLVDIDQNGAAYNYPGNQAPASYSRNADGDWYYSDATPGAANVDGENIVLGLEGGTPPTPPTPDYTNIVLNELNGDTKFIEIYNKGELDLAIEGWYITKDGNETDIKWTADATVVVPAHGYVLLYSVDVQVDHPEHPENLFFNSGLSAKKTVRIALYMADGTERDVFTRGTTGEWGQTISNVSPQSYARTPDGGDWKLADPTPNAANPATGDDIPQE
jgi:hypothetical protein